MAFRDYAPATTRTTKVTSLVKAALIKSKSKDKPYLLLNIAKQALLTIHKEPGEPKFVRLLVDDENAKSVRIVTCEESHPTARKLSSSSKNYLRVLLSWPKEQAWEKTESTDCESSIDYENEVIQATLPS